MISEQQIQQQQSSSSSSSIAFCNKNFNLYWLAATGLGVWFLFVHAPTYLVQGRFWERPMFCLHLLGAYGVYLACMHNALMTPSTTLVAVSSLWQKLSCCCWNNNNEESSSTLMIMTENNNTATTARSAHIWVGRIGLLLGLVAFVCGAYIAWTQLIHVDKAFVYFITIGGCFQVYAEIFGYREIKKYQKFRDILEDVAVVLSREERQDLIEKRDIALKKHISSMLGLFVLGCGTPALIRILGDNPDLGTVLAGLGLMNMIACLYVSSKVKKTQQLRSRPENEITPLM